MESIINKHINSRKSNVHLYTIIDYDTNMCYKHNEIGRAHV